MKRLLFSFFFFSMIALAVACSSPTASKPASAECASSGECASGLACLTLATFAADGGCGAGPQICSKTCTVDGDCASLGAKFKCFAGCNGPGTCGATP